MVENLAESPGMCSDGLGSARIKIPKEGAFSLIQNKKERERGRLLVFWERERRQQTYLLATWDPPARGARGRSGTPARTVRYLLQNVQYRPSSPRAARTVRAALADGPPGAAGQSGPLPRTVRPSFTFLA
jgi:hypothetical protein